MLPKTWEKQGSSRDRGAILKPEEGLASMCFLSICVGMKCAYGCRLPGALGPVSTRAFTG